MIFVMLIIQHRCNFVNSMHIGNDMSESYLSSNESSHMPF